VQLLEEQAAKQAREHPHGQEEAGSAGNPALAIRGNAAAWYDAMHMRMVQQILPPRVQDREETDLRTEMFWIGGDRAQRFGAGAEQHVVEHAFVLVRECRNGFW
jgi:hypothetical protein